MEALQRGGHRNSLLGPAHWLVFYNHSGQVCGDKKTLHSRGHIPFGVLPSGSLQPLIQGLPVLGDPHPWRWSQPWAPPWLVTPRVRVGWGELGSASCPTPQPEVNHVPLEGPVLEAPGRSLFGLSGVLTVGSSRCLHSHAEALRVRGWGWRRAAAELRAGRCLLAGSGTSSGVGELSACPGGRKAGLLVPAPGAHDSLLSHPLGKMRKLHPEIPLHSGLPAGGETGLGTIPSLFHLLSVL